MNTTAIAGGEHTPEFAVDAWRAEFASQKTEYAFRASIADVEVAAFWRAMLVCGPLYLVFIVSDYVQLGVMPAFWVILAARVFVCLLACFLAIRVRRDTARDGDTVSVAYLATRRFFVAALGLAFVIYPLSGRSYVELYPSLIVMLMAGFFFIPAHFADRLLAGIVSIAGFNIEAAIWMHPSSHDLPLALLLMFATLVFGAMAACTGALMRRQHYADTMKQYRLNLRLSEEVASRIHLQQEALNLAHTDPLTGIANRRRFLDLAEKECARIRRYGGPLAAVTLDIDYFKSVNDTYGHAAGDAALIAVAETCKTILRASDLLGRMGGEEFSMLLPQTDATGAIVLAERLRGALAGKRIPFAGGALMLTATIGVSEWRGGEDTLEILLRRADDALYDGKNAGRNRVVTTV